MVFGSDGFGSVRSVTAWKVKTANLSPTSYIHDPTYLPVGNGCGNELPYLRFTVTAIVLAGLRRVLARWNSHPATKEGFFCPPLRYMTRIRVKFVSPSGCSIEMRTPLGSQLQTIAGWDRLPIQRLHGPSCSCWCPCGCRFAFAAIVLCSVTLMISS